MVVNRIFLIGYMGSGKTTIGKRLAKSLNLQFVDLDFFLENRHRKTIGQIFQENGESGFREMEHKMLDEVANFENVVISTGGGAPCFMNNMDLMKRKGTTVYLKVSVEELVKRLNICKNNRPLLKDKSSDELADFITENLIKREDFYNCADIIFDAEKLLIDTDVEMIVSKLIEHLHLIEVKS